MSWYAWLMAGLCAALAGAALLTGNPLRAVGPVFLGMAVVIGGTTNRRQEAERQAAFAQRLRAARREPQAVVVVRRAAAGFPTRLVPLWVDVDGEARARLAAGTAASLPVSAGDRVVVVRRPWSAGRAATVTVPVDGSATVKA